MVGATENHFLLLGAELVIALGLGRHVWRLLHRARRGRGPSAGTAGGGGITDRQRWYREEYLTSEHWRQFRSQWWAMHGGFVNCVVCGKLAYEHHADLHHLTYARLGQELPGDVVGVHRQCHDMLEVAKRSGLGSAIWTESSRNLRTENRDAHPLTTDGRLRRLPTHPENRPWHPH